MIGLIPLLASQNARSGQAYKATVLADSPVGYWRLGEASGTNAADSSGNGNTGTYTGGVTLGQPGAIQADPDGLVNAAALFDGSSGYVQGPTAPVFTSAITAEGWFYLTSLPGAEEGIIVQRDGEFILRVDPSAEGKHLSAFVIIGGVAEPRASWSTVPSLNTWYHAAMTWDGTTLRLWVNGVQVASQTRSGSITSSGDRIAIGSSSFGTAGFFPGTIDEVAVYPTALSAARIAAHYAAAA